MAYTEARERTGRDDASAFRRLFQDGILPGLALAALIAATSFALRHLPGLGVVSPCLLYTSPSPRD